MITFCPNCENDIALETQNKILQSKLDMWDAWYENYL